jgi:hypothetical protein
MRDPTMRALLDLTENSEAERPSRRGGVDSQSIGAGVMAVSG